MGSTARLAASLEAYLFIHGTPVPEEELVEVMRESREAIREALDLLREKYSREDSGILLHASGAGLALATKKAYDAWLEDAAGGRAPLSPAALETLAVIADREPVTRAEVERIRGVSAGRILASLIEKDLIEERGRLEVPGRPILYGTTKRFLQCAGLSNIEEFRALADKTMTEGELF